MALNGYKPKGKPAMWRSVHPEAPAPAAKPRRIRAVSKRRQATTAEYRREAGLFVAAAVKAGMRDVVVALVPELRNGFNYGWPISSRLNEVHHFYGRVGRLLTAQWGWFSRSKAGHRWIHENIEEARLLDLICQPGLWNNYEAALADAVARGWTTYDEERKRLTI